MRTISFVGAIAALSLSAVAAQATEAVQPRSATAPARESTQPSVAKSGEFSVLQDATLKPDDLHANWLKQGPALAIEPSHEMHRHVQIVTFLIFFGCRADVSGNCNVTADFDVISPDGKLYAHQPDTEIWVGHPAPPPGHLQLSGAGLALTVEDQDPLGPYRIQVSTTDHVAGITLHTEQALVAIPD